MRLKDYYYRTISMDGDATDGTFRIALLPECDIYRGHFPGQPVCPGAYNMQAVKECAEQLTGRALRLSAVRRCRLTAVATPDGCPELEIRLRLRPTEAGYDLAATVADGHRTYMELKGELTA